MMFSQKSMAVFFKAGARLALTALSLALVWGYAAGIRAAEAQTSGWASVEEEIQAGIAPVHVSQMAHLLEHGVYASDVEALRKYGWSPIPGMIYDLQVRQEPDGQSEYVITIGPRNHSSRTFRFDSKDYKDGDEFMKHVKPVTEDAAKE